MRNGKILCIGLLVLLGITACHRRDSDDSPPAPAAPQSYGASLTAAEITRVGDRQALPVNGLPAEGAELTVR